ncbi:hypothetical protein BsWGS_01207 [Bradybaena similaris]
MDMFWKFKSPAVVLIYILSLLGGLMCRSQQPLDLYNLPRFLPTNTNFTYKVGQVAVLECAIENLEDKKVVWRLASDPTPISVGYMSFNEDPRYSVEHDNGGSKWNLVIRDVKTTDSGVYECQVSSRIRHLRHHVTLMVIDTHSSVATSKPNIHISGSNYVDEGERIFLICNASSQEYPPEDIDWFRAGNTLTTDEARGMHIRKTVSISTGTMTSSLEIEHARLSDQGVYVCRTSNKDVTSTQVNVLNGDSYNVKRGTVKKDRTLSENEAIVGEEKNTGNKTKTNITLLLAITIVTCQVWWYSCMMGLT